MVQRTLQSINYSGTSFAHRYKYYRKLYFTLHFEPLSFNENASKYGTDELFENVSNLISFVSV